MGECIHGTWCLVNNVQSLLFFSINFKIKGLGSKTKGWGNAMLPPFGGYTENTCTTVHVYHKIVYVIRKPSLTKNYFKPTGIKLVPGTTWWFVLLGWKTVVILLSVFWVINIHRNTNCSIYSIDTVIHIKVHQRDCIHYMHNNNYYYEYNINYTELYLLELGDSSILLVMIDSEKKYHDSNVNFLFF